MPIPFSGLRTNRSDTEAGPSASRPRLRFRKGSIALWVVSSILFLAPSCRADDLTSACVDQTMFYDTASLEAPSVPDARPSVVVVGSSTAEGFYGPSVPDSGYVWRLASLLHHRKAGECLTNLAVQGYTTFDTRSAALPDIVGKNAPNPSRNIDRAMALRPALVIIHLPTNDAADYLAFDDSRNNLLDMVHRADSAGSKVLLVGPQPRDSLDISQLALLLQWKAFFDTLSIAEVVNPWDSLSSGSDSTRLDPAVDFGDGVHLDDSGQSVLFRMVQRSRTWRSLVPGAADDTSPAVEVVGFAMPAQGLYVPGSHLDFTTTFSMPVAVSASDTPSIRLDFGGNQVAAAFDSGSGTRALRFRYIVQPTDRDSTGIRVARWIEAADSAMLDSAGNPIAMNIDWVDDSDSIRIVANQPPYVSTPFRDTTLDEGSKTSLVYCLRCHFADSDAVIATFQVSGDSSILRFGISGDTLHVSPREYGFGTDSIVLTATDALGSTVSDSFAIVIRHVDQAPTLVAPFADTTVEEDFAPPLLYPLAGHFHDTEGVLEAYRVACDSSSIRCDLASDTLRITSRPLAFGTDSVVVSALDDSGKSVSDTFVVAVLHRGSTSIAAKPRASSASTGPAMLPSTAAAVADQISPAPDHEAPQLGLASRGTCGQIQGCSRLGIEVRRPGLLQVSIFDNLGVFVLAGSWQVLPSDLVSLPDGPGGTVVDTLLWNQRSSTGSPVSTGIYLWKILYLPDTGNKVETMLRMGIRPNKAR